MNYQSFPTYAEMSKAAAKIIADVLRAKPDCVLGLATGSSPIGAYDELARMHREEGLSFARCTSVNLDEYRGLAVPLMLTSVSSFDSVFKIIS